MKKEYKVSTETGRILDLIYEFTQLSDKVYEYISDTYGKSEVDRIYEEKIGDRETNYRESLIDLLLLQIKDGLACKQEGPEFKI